MKQIQLRLVKDFLVPDEKLNFPAQLSGVGSYSLEGRRVP